MTDRELLQQALDALETHAKQYPHMVKGYTADAAEAIRTRLAQPEPEPVAVVGLDMSEVNVYYGSQYCGKKQETKIAVFLKDVLIGTRLYTAPPQRKEWVGLTDEEYFILQMKIKTPMVSVGDYIDAMKMVEEKLKEKNGF